jgi:hypothetical protein
MSASSAVGLVLSVSPRADFTHDESRKSSAMCLRCRGQSVLASEKTAGILGGWASGNGFEDRQDLLGHRSGRITTHYSSAELSRLIEGANSVVERDGRQLELVALHRRLRRDCRYTPASAVGAGGNRVPKFLKGMVARPRLELGTYGL